MSELLLKALEDCYDSMPYESHPFPQTAPEHLCAVASLFGLQAPLPAGARVLEIGCAAGGNLIPFALRNPDADVLGIDLSTVQIRQGKESIARLGIKNLKLEAMNIADATNLGQFDYIICHGVYSWVPQSVQQAILQLCGHFLCDTGVAYISYNTYPGWKMREILRDAMMLRAGTRTDLNEKLSYARGMLDFIEQVSQPNSALRKALDENLPIVRNGSPYYLHHEFLEPCNAPCYFKDFLAHAQAHGLDYLADADPHTMFASNYGSDIAEPLLREVAGNQALLEQYLDFVTNRCFRQTLLIKSTQKARVSYQLDAARLNSLHFAGSFSSDAPKAHADMSQPSQKAEKSRAAEAAAAQSAAKPLRTWRGNAVLALNDIQELVMRTFDEAYPNTLTLSQLAERAALDSPADQKWLGQLVENLLIQGHLRFRSQAVKTGRAQDQARVHTSVAEFGGWANNLWHDSIQLDALGSALVHRMQTPWTDEDLNSMIDQAAHSGALLLTTGAENPADLPKSVQSQRLRALLPERLLFMQRSGLLAPTQSAQSHYLAS